MIRSSQIDDAFVGRHENLDAVFAGVAGAADQRRVAGDVALDDGHALGLGAVVEQLAQDRAGLRALKRDHRVLVGAIDHVDVEAAGLLGEPLEVGLRGLKRW